MPQYAVSVIVAGKEVAVITVSASSEALAISHVVSLVICKNITEEKWNEQN